MNIGDLITQLQEIKTQYPNLSNDEVLKLMQLKILSEIRENI